MVDETKYDDFGDAGTLEERQGFGRQQALHRAALVIRQAKHGPPRLRVQRTRPWITEHRDQGDAAHGRVPQECRSRRGSPVLPSVPPASPRRAGRTRRVIRSCALGWPGTSRGRSSPPLTSNAPMISSGGTAPSGVRVRLVDEVHPAARPGVWPRRSTRASSGAAGDDGVEELDEHAIASEYLRRDRLSGRQRAEEFADDGFRGESAGEHLLRVSRVT